MYSFHFLLYFLIVQSIPERTYGQQQNKFFRKDYQYLEETQSFYKLHTIHQKWEDAKKTCALEGATLFYPEDESELNAVSKYWQTKRPVEWIFIGVSDLLSEGDFVTSEGIPITDIYNNWREGEPTNSGNNEDCVQMQRNSGFMNDIDCSIKQYFICKKTLAALEWNAQCELPYTNYVLNEALGRCYTFHLTPLTWTEAYRVCSAEQSYLAVINSQKEADYLVKITEQAPKDKVRGNYMVGSVFLGLHNRNKDGWYTVKGTLMEHSGYFFWGYLQSEGRAEKQCGAMFYNGELNALGCDNKCFFICEHEVKLKFDERSGDTKNISIAENQT